MSPQGRDKLRREPPPVDLFRFELFLNISCTPRERGVTFRSATDDDVEDARRRERGLHGVVQLCFE